MPREEDTCYKTVLSRNLYSIIALEEANRLLEIYQSTNREKQNHEAISAKGKNHSYQLRSSRAACPEIAINAVGWLSYSFCLL